MVTTRFAVRAVHFAGLVAAAVLASAGYCVAHPGEPGHEGRHRPAGEAAAGQPQRQPASRVEIVERDGYRYITANGLPDHDTGRFPNRGNPNAIREQRYRFRVPLRPQANDTPRAYDRQPFGVALNGVVFDPFTAGFWRDDRSSGWRETADPNKRVLGIDANAAHVQPNGAYHYHGIPSALIDSDARMTLVGWAADGFPIYGPMGYAEANDASSGLVRLRSSYRVKAGSRPADGPPGRYDGTYEEDYEYVAGLGDLDECNGRFGVTPEFPEGTYYYVLTDDYPWVPRLFRGTPDASFERRGQGGPPGGERRGEGPEGRRPGPLPRGRR